MPETSDDVRLLSDCISGKKEAWDRFVLRFSRLIYYAITSTLRLHNHNLPRDDVDDLYNGVFVSLLDNDFRKLRQYEGRDGCTLPSWIRLITVRHTIDFLRSRKDHVSLNDDNEGGRPLVETLEDRGESFEERLESAQAGRALAKAIAELPASDRLFMELFYEKELSPEEIAEIMNVSVNTVYSRKNRAREKLKNIMIESGAIARNKD